MRDSTKRRKAQGALPDTSQRALGFEVDSSSVVVPPVSAGLVEFRCGDPNRIFVGNTPVREYVRQHGLQTVAALADLLREFDFSAFTSAYKPGGRPPIHPRVMVGLIVYGIVMRQGSLRELEALAVRDVGAWLVCEGIQPDHSTIGKFVLRHEELLVDAFFVSATKALAKRLGVTPGDVAADGTIVQAAASIRSLARREQVREELEAASARAAASLKPEDVAVEAQLKKALVEADRRAEAKKRLGRTTPTIVSKLEPEAVNQPGKDGTYRPAYKPSVLAHESGLIVGQSLHPTNEVVCLEPMLKQHDGIFHAAPRSLSLDAGYSQIPVLKMCVERDLDVLCPSGTVEDGKQDWTRRSNATDYFPKKLFKYDADSDSYVCPLKQVLRPVGRRQSDRAGREWQDYRTDACKTCRQLSACTRAAKPRVISRYAGDDLKEAMAAVLSQPAARAKYKRRAEIVEQRFAQLKERYGLKRFRRRGTRRVRLEFALHCLAYNVNHTALRVVALRLAIVDLEANLVEIGTVVVLAVSECRA